MDDALLHKRNQKVHSILRDPENAFDPWVGFRAVSLENGDSEIDNVKFVFFITLQKSGKWAINKHHAVHGVLILADHLHVVKLVQAIVSLYVLNVRVLSITP